MGKRKSEDTYYAKTLDKRVKSANKKAAKGCGNIHTMLYGVRASSAAAREDGPSQPVETSPSVEKDIPPVEKEMTSAEKVNTSMTDGTLLDALDKETAATAAELRQLLDDDAFATEKQSAQAAWEAAWKQGAEEASQAEAGGATEEAEAGGPTEEAEAGGATEEAEPAGDEEEEPGSVAEAASTICAKRTTSADCTHSTNP